jgi:hypothetical protein
MRNITVAITVDDRMGIAFNKRRQSRDRLLIADLCENTDGVIYVSPYSAPLFEEYSERVAVLDSPLADCPIDSTCFVEMTELGEYVKDISALTVYRWNRHYPSDKKLDIDISSCGFTLSQSYEFVGKSHDKITKEIYKKHS